MERKILISCVLALLLLASQPAFAVAKTTGPIFAKAIPAGKEDAPGRVASGFGVEQSVTRSEFVSLVINMAGLNLSGIEFIKAPEIKDVAPDVNPGAPYAWDLIVAGHFGIVENGKPFRPNDPVLRQEAAGMAMKVLEAKMGPFNVTGELVPFNDDEGISPELYRAVHDACKLNLIVPEGMNIRPGDVFTAADRDIFMPAFKKAVKLYSPEVNEDGVSYRLQGNVITLYWGEKPTGGYEIAIDSASMFIKEGILHVSYTLKSPAPGDIVTMAITYPQASAAIPASGQEIEKVQLINKASVGKKNKDGSDDITYKISGRDITLYWGEKPSGGYAVTINSVKQVGSTLMVNYSLKSPSPGEMVPTVVTYPKATAKIPKGKPIKNVILVISE